jgi:hypothetical protein
VDELAALLREATMEDMSEVEPWSSVPEHVQVAWRHTARRVVERLVDGSLYARLAPEGR